MTILPPALQAGDGVAVVSPCAGAAAAFPTRFDRGLAEFARRFDVRVTTTPHARETNAWLRAHPRERVDDLHEALGDPDVRAIVCAIGGDDAVRLLPYLDLDLIAQNPKIFLGYSDPTVLHLAWAEAGVASFYGPGILAGFDENDGLPDHTAHSVRRTLFSVDPVGPLQPAPEWTEEHLDWNDESIQRRRRAWPNAGWTWLGGTQVVEGPLIGGCLEVLTMALGSSVWPDRGAFDGAVLVLETSEEKPPLDQVGHMLRGLGAAGVFDRLGAVIVGRPMSYSQADTWRQYETVLAAAAEFDRADLPVVGGFDTGHTAPHTVLPLGVSIRIDPARRAISLPHPAVSPR